MAERFLIVTITSKSVEVNDRLLDEMAAATHVEFVNEDTGSVAQVPISRLTLAQVKP